MKISSEILNLHHDVTWQKEYGLNESQLKKLLMKPCVRMMDLLGASGAYLNLFNDRDGADFFVGEQVQNKAALHSLWANKDLSKRFEWFTPASNNALIENVNLQCDGQDIGFVLFLLISDIKNNINGYFVFYGGQRRENWETLGSALMMFEDAIIDKLLLQKNIRLNQDQKELQILIADTQTHAIFAKDKDSKIVFANDLFMSFYPPEMQDKVIGFTTAEDYEPQQRELFLQDDQQAFNEGEKRVVETIDFPSGERKVLETTKKHFVTREGEDYILGVAYDLTQKYELIELLEKKNADLDKIASLIATDLRTPALAMMKLLRWLKEDLAHVDLPDVHEHVEQLTQRTTRINKLLGALYNYWFAGRDKHRNGSVVLTTMSVDLLGDLKAPSNVRTTIDDVKFEIPLPPFKTVLKCIMCNAIEHSNTDELTIGIDYHSEKDHHVITLCDNGKGIADENAEQVFSLFYSTKDSNASEVYGLGLAIARKIVESYQGSLTLDTSYSKGAKFVIKWPLH
ncbi:sensor histidine kinase [Glaciecola sp. 2405UD65-10]|uniref:sensor histidine kinase n=1 Tax=Glaciecola sp. 2405UD65-10 TaxID=3397244 RepID=UPI003B5AE4B8